ncbi:hypothetical protein Hanom_Chr03g00248381 [Helianthus anomalus]
MRLLYYKDFVYFMEYELTQQKLPREVLNLSIMLLHLIWLVGSSCWAEPYLAFPGRSAQPF